MRIALFLLSALLVVTTWAQESQKDLVFKNIAIPGYRFDIYAENPTSQTISYIIDFEVEGYNASHELQIKDTIAPGVRKKVMHLKGIRREKERNFSYGWQEKFGNIYAKHNFNHKYTLPYAEGKAYKVTQGYDEGSSHGTIEAIDFAMPMNSPVRIARRGLVVETRNDSNQGCPEIECDGKSNYVRVLHYDDTFAVYKNMVLNSITVEEGDYVDIGDVIGLSGASGAAEPQLHFQVERLHPSLNHYITIPTKFTVNGRGLARVLVTGDSITRPNNIQ